MIAHPRFDTRQRDENSERRYLDDNPKTAVGVTKVPLHLVPPAAIHGMAEALADGARKYGPYNWRQLDITVSTYVAAALRHIHAYWDGEDCAPDSGIHHIKHAMAGLGLLLDAMALGKAKDDRPPAGMCPAMQQAYESNVGFWEIAGYDGTD